MPNIITHSFFGDAVYKEMKSSFFKEAIDRNKEAYTIGCSGPDFLFFHVLTPRLKTKSKSLSKYGSQLHKHNINLFYDCAIKQYHKQQNPIIKEAMASYITGHFMHWRLDSMVHPYIFYTTGYPDLKHMSHHHRAESMIDCILLKQYKQQSIRTFKTYELCTCNETALDAISEVYIEALEVCCHAYATKQDIKDALGDWKRIQRWLHDPYRIKYGIVSIIESILRKPWLLTGNMIPIKEDHRYDVMNNLQTTWHHPCDNVPSNESVEALLDKAKHEAHQGLMYLEDALKTASANNFLDYLKDATYESGKDDTHPMLFQDDVYER